MCVVISRGALILARSGARQKRKANGWVWLAKVPVRCYVAGWTLLRRHSFLARGFRRAVGVVISRGALILAQGADKWQFRRFYPIKSVTEFMKKD